MLRGTLLGAISLSLAVAAGASVPDLNLSTAETAHPGASVMVVVPEGGLIGPPVGTPLTSARAFGGYFVDATITLTLIDSSGEPIADYPREDIWLESSCEGFVYPPFGTSPDLDTDMNGVTVWTGTISGGGCSPPENPILVMVAGAPLSDTLELGLNSQDLNGDLLVNHLDVDIFSALLQSGSYDYCIDFNFDGVINVVDIGLFMQGIDIVTDCYYEPCQYRLGIFFDDSYYLEHHEGRDAATNIDYQLMVPFDMHIVAISCPEPVSGYEAYLEFDPAFDLLIGLTIPGGGSNFHSSEVDHLVTYSSPRPPSGVAQAVLLSTLSVMEINEPRYREIRVLPAPEPMFACDGPLVFTGAGLARANFTPSAYSGCLQPLSFGEVPPFVATTYGSGVGTSVGGDPPPQPPQALAISAVAPNPFNPTTTVTFEVPATGAVTLTVHDSRGRLVQTLWLGSRPAGRHQITWDGHDAAGGAVPSGVYLVRLAAADGTSCASKVTVAR